MRNSVKNMLGVFILSLSAASFADTNQTIMQPDNLSWKELPNHPELQYAVLSGNPVQKGLFTVRMKFPKDYADVVHAHDLPRYDTVISGSYYLGFGDKVDKSKAEKLVAGSFVTCPAHMKHFGYTDDETVIQISGMGPWEVLKSKGEKR